ncbi:MAG TPA: hypothetical protein VH062_22470 [Polyangiaceae bacterium]|nr:hypothetical protein [Polyangiaceae bacterium]
MAVQPMCDCDGDGPLAPFEQNSGDVGIVDGWLCQCQAGTWECFLSDQSGSSCFRVCGPDSGYPQP